MTRTKNSFGDLKSFASGYARGPVSREIISTLMFNVRQVRRHYCTSELFMFKVTEIISDALHVG